MFIDNSSPRYKLCYISRANVSPQSFSKSYFCYTKQCRHWLLLYYLHALQTLGFRIDQIERIHMVLNQVNWQFVEW